MDKTTSATKELLKLPYYHGLLVRDDVSKMLKNTGDFLLRVSEPEIEFGRGRKNVVNSNIELVVKDIVIHEKDEIDGHTNNLFADDGGFINDFARKAKNIGVAGVILFTGRDTLTNSAEDIGLAFGESFCPTIASGKSNIVIVKINRFDHGKTVRRLLHEIGHALGADHDDEKGMQGYNYSCDGHLNGARYAYLMHSTEILEDHLNNLAYSDCSKRQINEYLTNQCYHAFVKDENHDCGNGLIDANEACDEGHKLNDRTFGSKRRCCTDDCKLVRNASCSDSKDSCCDENCRPMEANVICRGESKHLCQKQSVCNGINSTCPKAEKMEDGSICYEDGGQCSGGLCKSFCKSQNPEYENCICQSPTEICMQCCRNLKTGVCSVVNPIRHLKNGESCSMYPDFKCNQHHVCEFVGNKIDSESLWQFLHRWQTNLITLTALLVISSISIYYAYKCTITCIENELLLLEETQYRKNN
uniref:Disintegrin domain-containing protein n=1 Tax=Rhabditophanes sp. KR3021 TaxID=114890 RepID=A0AC35TIN4_9BILA